MAALFSIIAAAIALSIIAVIAYFAYLVMRNIANATRQRLDQKGVTLSKSGAEVKVKSVNPEKYFDQTQKALVGAWNHSETKGYKSRFWTESEEQKAAKLEEKRRVWMMIDGKKVGVVGSEGANEGWA